MPGQGRISHRALDSGERSAFGDSLPVIGEETWDVFLNEQSYWKNVPRSVWEYSLGGYQVLKKWLSYRDRALLGRSLTIDEVGYFRDVVRRITALLLLGHALDANYRATRTDPYAWPES